MRQLSGRLVLGAVAAGTAVGVAWLGASAPLRGQAAVPAVGTAAVAGGFGGENEQNPWPNQVVHVPPPPMTAAAAKLWLKMQEPVTFSFPNETPLIDVLKYARQVTQDPKTFPKGIAFHLDPKGLQSQDKTPTSPVTIDLEGIPLATALKLCLDQLDLGYEIHPDGFVVISEPSEYPPDKVLPRILDEVSALRDQVEELKLSLARRPEPAGGGGMSGGMQGPAGGMGGKGGMMSVPPGR